MRNLFKSKQLYLQPAEGMKEVIGLIFPNRPQQQRVRSVPMHTKACNPTSFLKLLSHTVILPEQGHFIIIECRTGMRKNYFFARDICHHWAGALIHLLSSNSWGHTCKSHLISFTGVAEQAVCSHSSSVFTSKVNPRHGIYSLKTPNILPSWPEIQAAFAFFDHL